MDENKEKLNNSQPVPENDSESVRDEMEELAKVFREELAKAKEEAERSDDISELQIDGYNPQNVSMGAENTVSEDELCEYCGERRRGTEKNPDGPYCQECEETLEKYPYDYKGIIAAIVLICIAVGSIFCFAVNVPIFAKMKQGDKAAAKGQLYTAMEKYDEAVEFSQNMGSDKTLISLYAKRAITNFSMVNMNSAITEIDENIPEYALKLLTFKELNDILEQTERMQASALVVQQHLAAFPEVTEKNYDDIIADLDNLSGKKVYIKGTEYHDETEEDFVPDGTETVYICDEGWLNMYKYAAAKQLNKDNTVIAEYLQKCADSSEYMKTLTGALLATTYAGIGEYEKAETLAEELREINCESVEYHMIKAAVYRYRDNDFDKAIAICDEGIEMLENLSEDYLTQYGYMVQIQKALNLIMKDDYDSAYEVMSDAYYNLSMTNGMTVQTRDLFAMLALETGDDEVFKSLEDEIALYGDPSSAFTSDVTDYKEGRLTLKEIAESGRYDLI